MSQREPKVCHDILGDQEQLARARLAAIVRSSGDAIVGETLAGIITDWNPAAERLYGYTAAEVIGRHLSTVIPPERMAEADAILERVHRGETVEGVETVRRTKDGRRIEVALTISPVWDDSGALIATSAFVRDITTRRATETALAASETLFRVAFENAPIGMLMGTPDLELTRVNRALCEMLGYTADAILTNGLWGFTHPEDIEPNLRAIERALAGEITTYELEKRYIHRDGHVIWGHLQGSLVRAANGAPLYFVSQILDVSERKAAEAAMAQLTEELQASEAKYRTLVEQLPGAVYLLADDEKQTPLYFSPYIEAVTGETPEEAMAFHDLWHELVHPEDRARVIAEDERHGTVTDHFQAEYRHRHKNGSYVWVHDECVPVRDDAGQIVAWQGVMLDISDRMAGIAAQAWLAALVESAEDAVVSSTVEGIITSWNRGAERLYGYRADEIIGQSFAKLLAADQDPAFFEWRRTTVGAGLSAAPFETTRRRKDGTNFAASVSLSTIRDPTGSVIGVSSITRDITERKLAEAALREALQAAETANQAKSTFLSVMSHELRTPLQAILGYSEFLLADRQVSLTAEQRDDVAYIQQGGQRMLTLITQVLDLARIEGGRLELRTEPVDLAQIVEHVRQDAAPQAMQKGLALTIDVPPGLPPWPGDAHWLRHILLNLVGNAIKFTERGSVHVAVAPTANGVEVTVRDTGIGLPAEAISGIFEAFHQVESRLARRHGGAGLGLAIAKNLAQAMNGQITVQSVVGEGSTFTLHLARTPAR